MNMNFINALHALSMITEGAEDYQEKYKQYIIDHKKRVKQFADWMKKNLPEIFNEAGLDDFDELIREHDESKFSEEEFEPYARFWYNDSDHYDYDPEYEAAWEHHWKHNPHHPEYWLGDDMPFVYIIEMLCDWGSFGIAEGNILELVDYYYNEARDDDEKNLSESTKKIIEEILSKIEAIVKGGETNG